MALLKKSRETQAGNEENNGVVCGDIQEASRWGGTSRGKRNAYGICKIIMCVLSGCTVTIPSISTPPAPNPHWIGFMETCFILLQRGHGVGAEAAEANRQGAATSETRFWANETLQNPSGFLRLHHSQEMDPRIWYQICVITESISLLSIPVYSQM